jgi:hypothetical protein
MVFTVLFFAWWNVPWGLLLSSTQDFGIPGSVRGGDRQTTFALGLGEAASILKRNGTGGWQQTRSCGESKKCGEFFEAKKKVKHGGTKKLLANHRNLLLNIISPGTCGD